tara:strand:+ start:35 stop:3565 length:3531 start_codon:yes stop_codon:yes gene_type:complete
MNTKNTGRPDHNKGDSVEVVGEVPKSEVALREEEMLEFWREHDIFNKSVETPAGAAPKGDFVFYDGPPFATGLPHYGHILAGTIKDAIPRFWTMNGYRVRRKWGWDCHGLPLENLIEKRLGLATKRDIEEYGVKNFNEAARDAVMEYADDWKQIIPRMGRFADMENDYKTMDSTYTESVWWVFKSLHEKGLVFEGFKSMHLCPRCGTTLSNFEVNQGYKDIKDLSVFVELPLIDEENTSLIVWTTTPWTLPGNMAAAVHNDYEYAVVEKKDEGDGDLVRFIVAKEKLEAIFGGQEYEVVETRKGSDLVGKKYRPPFDYLEKEDFEGKENAWQILHADYVEIGEEGTGAVHLAPAYGEDDMVLAKEHGVPIYHHVDEAGHFKDFVTDFAGRMVKPKDNEEDEINHMDSDIEIIRALAAKGVLFDKEKITHSYPHCWRCDTPLLNYATTSWFVDVPAIKDKLVEENSKVNWVPEHVGTNRFGKWLEGARDWAVSRQRYWGAPLPIWKNPDTGEYKVFGSLAELQEYVPKSENTYYAIRHGESKSNAEKFLNGDQSVENPVTEKGIEQTKAAAKELPSDIDVIFHSPFQRTRETAELLVEELGLSKDILVEDERLRESGMGEVEGEAYGAKDTLFNSLHEEFTKEIKGVETLNQIRKRVGEFLYEIDKKYQGKKIAIVAHGDPLWMLDLVLEGGDEKRAVEIDANDYPKNAQVRERQFVGLPHNDYFELDFHRPYIDDVELFEDGVKLERVPDVFDCWFESGSMPYGQHHYPFKDKDVFEKEYFPAQFIAEGLDQTRGWFYSLIVLGTALFGKSPYENVIVNGLVMAEDGKKMSKSLQNYPDPMDLANRTGVDAVRHYLLSAPIMRGEDLNFSEKEVLELQRKNIGRLHNVLAMYEMFADETSAESDSDQALDRWVIARLNQLIVESTTNYKNYELDKATRPITDFVDDLSVWYLRRSRDRLKGEDANDKTRALATLRYTLRMLALVMAPAMPFYAEYLWQRVKEEGDAESVHLGAWPESVGVDENILVAMSQTREVVTAALEARTTAGIKVRQPVASVSGPEVAEELVPIVLDELNAKVYEITAEISIDTEMTPELLAEGAVRELMRAVQGARKQAGLEQEDRITLTIKTDEEGQQAVEANRELLVKTVGADKLVFGEVEGETLTVGEYNFSFSIAKQ